MHLSPNIRVTVMDGNREQFAFSLADFLEVKLKFTRLILKFTT